MKDHATNRRLRPPTQKIKNWFRRNKLPAGLALGTIMGYSISMI